MGKLDSGDKPKGLTFFPDGRWLIQLTRQGITKTRRGHGGERAGLAALKEVEVELANACRMQDAARMLGVELAPNGEPVKPLTFAQLFEDKYKPWAVTELDPVTWRTRESTHWHLLSYFGATPLDKITSEMVDAFKQKRLTEGVIYRTEQGAQKRKARALSKAGLAEQLKILRAILRWAVRKGHLKVAPVVDMPKDKRSDPGAAKPVRYFTREERARLLRRCKPALADVIRFSLLTGARPAETFHMRCRSVDLKRRVLTIEEQPCPLCPDGKWIPKVGTWRQLEIAPPLLPILRRQLAGKLAEDLVFDSHHGEPFTRLHGGGGSFNRALKRAGLARQGLSFYSLRHTFAADLASAGKSLHQIAKLMGHTDVRTTQRYAHLMPDALSGVLDGLESPDEWRGLALVPPTDNAPAAITSGQEVTAG